MIELQPAENRWTAEADLRALIYFAMQTQSGTIIEVGCNTGCTTLDLAMAFPHRKVIGVDCSDETALMAMRPEQRHEMPAAEDIGRMAKRLPNVRIFDVPSRWFLELYHDMQSKLGHSTVVFIDGNHSYEAVKRDTQAVLNNFELPVTIFWHDYYPEAPFWCAVKTFLDREMPVVLHRTGAEVVHIEGTWLAMLQVPDHTV